MTKLKAILFLRNVKSVKSKTMLIILPVTVAILLTVAIAAYAQSQRMLHAEAERVLQYRAESLTNQIDRDLLAHRKVTETLAQSVKTTFGDFALDDYRRLTESALDANADTIGIGIFFQPKAADPSAVYFSNYSYITEDGTATSTQVYNDPAYDYHNHPWYTVVGTNGERGAAFAPPFFDETVGIHMVTASVPVFDDRQRFIGVATGDIDLSTIQERIAQAKVGETGRAFLVDTQGMYIAGVDSERLMKTNVADDPNASLAAVGAKMLQGESGADDFMDEDGLQHLYYTAIPSTQWKLGVVIPDRELSEPASRLLKTILAIGAAGVLLLAVVIYLYTRSIALRIGRFNRLSDAMAQGDFTRRIEADTADEFGAMAANFNGTLTDVGRTLRVVTERAAQVTETSRQLRAGAEETNQAAQSVTLVIQDIAGGADRQVQGADESARALEEMSVGIQRIAESSSIASETTNDVSQRAQAGNDLMRRAEEQMQVILRSVDESQVAIRRLADRSKEIQQIVEAITEISAQTNLLALNASIEAARAGEHGRGFAVVAGEVKKLAEQTSRSTMQIADLIGMIQSETVAAVRLMDAGAAEAGAGSAIVGEAGTAFESILASIREVAAQVEDVSASAEQMSAGSQQVTASVAELAEIAKLASDNTQHAASSSEEQLAAMEQITASAMELSEMMQELQTMISRFKV
ncbi:methyl-accepting chemotaxis protein [Paenibacillus antri]|nr:methyl-accepting chemotaxis protein [Paenibacillus antri]